MTLNRRKLFWFVLAGTVLLSPLATATMVMPLNVAELTQNSDRVFVGECESVVDGSDSNNFPATFVSYRVLQMIKGEPATRISFKQYGILQDKLDRFYESSSNLVMTPYIYGQVQHQVGEKVLLFLRGDSELGFSGVVGMGQGKFAIINDASGIPVAENEFHNAFCFRKMAKGSPLSLLHSKLMKSEGTTAGPMPLSDLIGTIQTIVAEPAGGQ